MRNSTLVSVAVLAIAVARSPVSASEKPPALTDADKKELDELVRDLLFDPTGAERVRVPVTVYRPWGGSDTAEYTGWLVRGKDGAADRVFFTDRYNIPAPAKDVKKFDFLQECRDRYMPKPNAGQKDDPFKALRRNAGGTDPNLAMAAWLHKLGHDDLAAHALPAPGGKTANRPGDEEEPSRREALRDELAWHAFAGLVHGFVNRADEEALAHGERLLFLYKDLTDKKDGGFSQAAHIVRELKRRKTAGTFGKPAAKGAPAGFANLDLKSQVEFLIGQLDEVDARQMGQPGGVSLASDWRVEALIKIGEPAVPALIDCVEADERLTRSVHFWRDFGRHRTVLSVREAALAAVMSILRVSVFDSRSTGDNFTSRGDEGAKDAAAKLRKYWETYGKLPFDERMMKVLTDPKVGPEAWREAALNLSTIGAKRTIGTTFASNSWLGGRPPGPNPVVGKFNKPTVAEALLAALDRNLVAVREKKDHGAFGESRVEGFYLSCIAELEDKRIVPSIAERATKAKTVETRRRYAATAFDLGEPKPFLALAADFEAGKLPFPNRTPPGSMFPQLEGMEHDVSELIDLIKLLSQRRTAETDRALYALTDPKHPYFPTVVRIARGDSPYVREPSWYSHPFWLRLLRRALDDTTLTGTKHRIEGDRLAFEKNRGGGSGGIPDELADPKSRLDRADERACDQAAETVARVVVGTPTYHVLRRDREELLTSMKSLLDRFDGKFRLATKDECTELRVFSFFDSLFIPEVRPLGRPATAEDVRTGRAIFERGGQGKLADQELPAWLILKADAGKDRASRGLIVQAEIGADGTVTYGAIFRHAIRAVPASEVESAFPAGRARK